MVAGTATAGSRDDPEIEDPQGDAVHFEFGHDEPQLDVTKVWFAWTDGQLAVSMEIPALATPGPDGTQDALDDSTYYDVYWMHDGVDHVARAWFDADGEATYQAGQAMRIERVLLWPPGADIHGSLAEQSGSLDLDGIPTITLMVDPGAVGDPAPGDALEEPAFATYVDHHPPGQHHPGHVDQGGSDRTFVVPAPSEAEDPGDDPPAADDKDTPAAPVAAVLALLVAAVAFRRKA